MAARKDHYCSECPHKADRSTCYSTCYSTTSKKRCKYELPPFSSRIKAQVDKEFSPKK